MKKILQSVFCLSLILLMTSVYGQDFLKITYDASQGLGGEKDALVEGGMAALNPEKIYMHSGAGPWSDFPTDQNWGCDNGVGEMSKIAGSDVMWEITVSKEYYNIEEWSDIGLVFRSGGPCGDPDNPDDCGDETCLEAKSDLGSDIYIRMIADGTPTVLNQDDLVFAGVTAELTDEATGIDDVKATQSVLQAAPNPFNDVTNISYATGDEVINLTVYNALGQTVRVLSNEYHTAGTHSILWDGTNENGSKVATGQYFYVLETATDVQAKQLLIVR